MICLRDDKKRRNLCVGSEFGDCTMRDKANSSAIVTGTGSTEVVIWPAEGIAPSVLPGIELTLHHSFITPREANAEICQLSSGASRPSPRCYAVHPSMISFARNGPVH
jgi:hypothetical protein